MHDPSYPSLSSTPEDFLLLLKRRAEQLQKSQSGRELSWFRECL